MPARRPSYPESKKVDVVEDYHGKKVADPYRWLEDPDSEATHNWTRAQHTVTTQYLEQVEAHEYVKAQLMQDWQTTSMTAPKPAGDSLAYSKREGLQNQPILYLDDADGKTCVLLDPNTLSDDGTTALISTHFNQDGSKMAYITSSSGSDWQEVRVRDVPTAKDTDDVVQWCKYGTVSWKKDGSGFFYNRYPAPTEDGEFTAQTLNNKLYFHKLGTAQDDDTLIYERPDDESLNFPPQVTDDGQYIVLRVWHGSANRNRIYYREVEGDGDFVRLLDEADASYDFVGNDGTTFYFQTDLDAPKSRVIAIDIEKPERDNWETVIPEQDDTLDLIKIVNNHFVTVYLHDAYHRVMLYDMDGLYVREIELPTIGSILDLQGKSDSGDLFMTFYSFLYPVTALHYDFATETLAPFKDSESANTEPYETKQVFYTSKDGTRVPMFLCHKKGLALDGENPTILYGYGGFNVSYTPVYHPWIKTWLAHGGIFAMANMRGGGEYGEEWHKAGMLENKQNVFDDFIAAAEWLIMNGYTRRDKLAIEGRSNGGLLVAACMLQRPDLYGAVLCHVPVIDMLRYQKFTAGRYWTYEYGNGEENPDHFDFLMAYSPLHNVKAGVDYPPTLITTADTDDRVVPMHSKKFAATLQSTYKGKNPILLRIEMKAGHGMGKPTTKLIEERADVFAFLFDTLGIKV